MTGASVAFCEILAFCKGICHLYLVIFAIMLMINSGTLNIFCFHLGDVIDLSASLLQLFCKNVVVVMIMIMIMMLQLMDYEPRASLQIPLLLRLGENLPALVKAIESGNTDLVYTVLLHLRENMPLGDFQVL